MTPICWFQSLFSRSNHLPRRRRSAERLAPSGLAVLEKRTLLSAAQLVVTTNQDVTSSTDGLISLREALAFAASNPGDDTITFGDGSAIAGGTNFTDATGDTITLGGTELSINSNVTLDGPGAALLSISGNNASRVFIVNSGVTAAIRDVTITGGNLPDGIGGGIFNNGTLTVSHSTISRNRTGAGTGFGGGIFSNATLTVSHSAISGNTARHGGGISNSGTLIVSDSSISGNAAARQGGGIENVGTMTVSHSSISGNTASLNGGGIMHQGSMTVIHSTIFGNAAGNDGGGILNYYGSGTIVNSTLVNNRADSDGNNTGTGGGIWTDNNAVTFTTLHNTIMAGNFVGTGVTANEVANKTLEAASRNNLIGHAGSAGGLTNGTNGNIVGALMADIFETGVLANNGGPTQTIALKAGGPAVNAGDNASVPADTLDLDSDLNTTEPVPFDQRGTGFDRIVGTAVDIGAFEFKETPGLVVTTNQDVLNNTDGLTSLREALAFALSNPGADTITFGNGSAIAGGTNFTDATGDTITLGGTELTINSNVTLDGPGAALLSISGNNASRVFMVDATFTAEIRNLTIAGGNTPDSGGGILNLGTLTVSHSTISGNTANTSGGISNAGRLAVSHSTISGNTASFHGGGIASNGTLTVSHSTISGNTATGNGGGILNVGESTTIVNSTLVNNRADSDGKSSGTGGGIWTWNDNVTFTTLHNTIVAGNFVGTGTTANDVAEKSLEAASRNNLIGHAGSAGGLTNGTNGNIVGALVADIFETGALANNGGPTQTIALKASSPAVNAGDNASVPADALDLDGDLNTTEPVPFDQRGTGFPRIIGTAVDIGAIEADEAPSLVVTTTQDVVNRRDGLTSLREALAFALSNPGADTITFGNGSAIAGGTNFTDATGDTITLGGTELTINSNVTLDGPGAALLSISGNNTSGVFSVNFGVTAEIRDVTITGGSSIQGGGILSRGTLTVSNSTISGNASTNSGGGIAGFGPMTVSHSTISGNTAREDGGGIFSNETLMVSHSTISGNTATGNGGGIFNGENSTTIVNSTLVNNRADSDGNSSGTGGGIWTFNDNFIFTTLHNTIVAGNFVGTGTTANDVAEKPLEAASRNNLIGHAGSAGGLTNGTNGNIVGTLVADIFETGVLANNGGPTQTIALKASSPAVNAGDNASIPADTLDLDGDLNTTEPVPFDQRGTGFPRIIGGIVDIGAFERANSTPTDVTLSANTIAENAGVNVVIGSLAGVDPNPNDALTLSLPAGLTDNALFNISGGNLRANSSFNFETNSSYIVTVRVTDFDGATFDKPLTISVTDVNEAPTAMSLQNTTTTLAENTSTAAAIRLADIVVTDDALGTNVLSLSGPDAAFFRIVSNRLWLRAGTVLNFEAKSSYSVTVNVNDAAVGGAVDASQSFTLTITNVNEAPTAVALQNTTATLAEDTSTSVAIRVADIVVTDDALGTNALSLSGPDAASFRIVNNRLFLKSGVTLNFVTKPVYSVTVNADDATVGGSPDASVGFTLNIASFAPTTVNVTTPTRDMTPTITWSAIPSAVSYDVWITNVSANRVLPLRNVTTNSYTPTEDLGIGSFRVWVRSRNAAGAISRWSNAVNFEINTPVTLDSIVRRQGTPRPTITWQPLLGAVRYEIWLGSGVGGSALYRDAAVTGTSWTPPSDLAVGRYLAWVRGFSADGKPAQWSGSINLLTEFLVVPAPTLVSPLHATFDRTPTFQWSAVMGGVSYILRVRNANTGVLVFEQTSTSTNFTPTTALPDNSYRWDVRAVGAKGQESNVSTSNILYVGGRPVIFGPTGTAASSTPTLTWSAVEGAVRYELRLDRTDVVQNRLIVETNLTSTSYTPTSALASGSYRFWVRAVSASGEFSPWSNLSAFSVADVTPDDQVSPHDVGSEFLLAALPTLESQLEADPSAIDDASQRQTSDAGRSSGQGDSVNLITSNSISSDNPEEATSLSHLAGALIHDPSLANQPTLDAKSRENLFNDLSLIDTVMERMDLF